MNARHGLSDQTVLRIQDALARFPTVSEAVLFGSRAKGMPKRGSDIDLALSGDGLDWQVLARIENALDDLLLPYSFSLLRRDARTAPEIEAHIARVGLPLYARRMPEKVLNSSGSLSHAS